MKRLPLILILALGFVVAGLVSCEKEKIVEAEPAIKVTEVVASDTMVTQGKTVTLTATLETDEEVDAASIELKWFAANGEFVGHVSEGDTVTWKAPAEDGVYRVTVHATDGENIAIGMRDLGVNEYAPSADVYYVGDEACGQCHGDTHTDWAETGHADAWASLQSSGHPAPYCEPCHTVNQVDTDGNSGYDEVPTAKFVDVQCESCHGPGSDHISGPSADNITSQEAILAEETCAVCHEGGHHPYHEQWTESAHNFDPATAAHGAGARSYCQPCHSGTGFVEAFDDEYTDLYANAENKMGITCGVCHDSHNSDNVGQLRTVASYEFLGGEVADEGGAGQLCVQCHHARHDGEEQIPAGDEHFGPHGSTQGDVVYGTTGYEEVAPDFQFASTGHGLVEDACAACHVYMTEYDETTDFANVGHTFEPRVESCSQCHGSDITDSFRDIQAKNDFDNDNSIEPVQDEVEGLIHLLAVKLVEYDNANNGGKYLDNPDPNADGFLTTVMDSINNTYTDSTESGAVELRKGGFNLFYAYDDGSTGIHNPAYVIQLLQQSVLYYDPNAFDDGGLLVGGKATTLGAADRITTAMQ
ncbi:MAG: hypothetical protein K9N46_14690 [Candidatus Marinimicrobia bacterium]|nr:hypothetical protein [Candidatus Neomarinimicrobiota bacterium]MCF7828487.1 hypothetical protein [Candidatus Neomarinimicrobiota bacterium]MCF7881977.1 hypothetical protein [Candidatus Neomarinimicrobiota bacterium]